MVDVRAGQAEARQVEGAKIALQHNFGLGGACVVTMYDHPGSRDAVKHVTSGRAKRWTRPGR